MTSSTDTNRHPDVSEIADLTEGLLPFDQAAELRRHLEGCAVCADVRTSLEEIRGLLGTLPGPGRMPGDVAGRIDAALAAEALLQATTPDPASDVSRETKGSSADGGSLSHPDRPSGHSRGATGPGRTRRSRRRLAAFGAVLGAAAVGVGVLVLQGLPSTVGDAGRAQDASLSSAAGADGEFSGEPIDERVRSLLSAPIDAAEPRIEKGPSLEAEAPGMVTPQSSPDSALPPCVQRGTGRGEQPLAFEQGQYQGTGAYLVVLPHAADRTQVDAYVVDASCTEDGGADAGSLLLDGTYPLE